MNNGIGVTSVNQWSDRLFFSVNNRTDSKSHKDESDFEYYHFCRQRSDHDT